MEIRETKVVSPTQLVLKFYFTPEETSSELDKVAKEIQPMVELKGFRKGHAPLQMVKTKFFKEIFNDALNALADKALADWSKAESRDIYDRYVLDQSKLQIAYKDGEGIEIEIHVEADPAVPEIPVGEIELFESAVKIPKAMLEQRAAALQQKYSFLAPAADRDVAVEGDVIICDISVADADLPDKKTVEENVEIDLGKPADLKRLPFPAVKEIILKAKLGVEQTETLDTPEKTKAIVSVLIKEIKVKKTPAIGAELWSLMGENFASDEEFNKYLEKETYFEWAINARDRIVQVFSMGVQKKFAFQPPLRLFYELYSRFFVSKYPNVFQIVKDKKKLSREEESLVSEIDNVIKMEASAGAVSAIVMKKLAKQVPMEISDAEVDEYLKKVAELERVPVEKIRAEQSAEEWKEVYREFKLMEYIRANAKIVGDKEWEEEMHKHHEHEHLDRDHDHDRE